MPGIPPRWLSRTPTPASGRHGLESSQAPTPPGAILAAIESDLERARAEYSARAPNIDQTLEEIQKRIEDARAVAPAELEPEYALVEASLITLQGRRWSWRNPDASQKAFLRAVELFKEHERELAQHHSRTRFWTDWGISLYRIGRNDEALHILSGVCASGAASAEAFGYLGYAHWTAGHLEEALNALRKGLEIAPTNLTINFYHARVLADIARHQAATGEPKGATETTKEAAEAYCRAGEIAASLGDHSSAGRDGVRALMLDPTNERALYLAADAYRMLRRQKLALQIVEEFLKHSPGHPTALGIKGVLLRDLNDWKQSIDVLRAIPVESS